MASTLSLWPSSFIRWDKSAAWYFQSSMCVYLANIYCILHCVLGIPLGAKMWDPAHLLSPVIIKWGIWSRHRLVLILNCKQSMKSFLTPQHAYAPWWSFILQFLFCVSCKSFSVLASFFFLKWMWGERSLEITLKLLFLLRNSWNLDRKEILCTTLRALTINSIVGCQLLQSQICRIGTS